MDAEELSTQLKRSTLFSRDTSNIVYLTLGDGQMQVHAKSPAYGEYNGQMPIQGDVKTPISIAFNTSYLSDFISNTKVESITFSLIESLRPAQFEVKGVGFYKYIVMPFRTNEAT